MAAPGEARGDNHPLESRRLKLIESVTHTNTVMLGGGAVSVSVVILTQKRTTSGPAAVFPLMTAQAFH